MSEVHSDTSDGNNGIGDFWTNTHCEKQASKDGNHFAP